MLNKIKQFFRRDKRSERQKHYEATDFKTEVCTLCQMSHKNYNCLNDNT